MKSTVITKDNRKIKIQKILGNKVKKNEEKFCMRPIQLFYCCFNKLPQT